MTLELDIDASYDVVGFESIFVPEILARSTISAKRNDGQNALRCNGGRDISWERLLRVGYVQWWYDRVKFDTKSRNALSAIFDPLHGKGDLSISLTSSTGGGTSAADTTTFSAKPGRS
jgi:hypothetical protein